METLAGNIYAKVRVYRSTPGSDIWLCEMCNTRGDKWFLEEHWCSRNLKKSRKCSSKIPSSSTCLRCLLELSLVVNSRPQPQIRQGSLEDRASFSSNSLKQAL